MSGSAAVKGHKYVFDVCTPDRKYYLAADTPSEKHEWILTLNEVLFSTSIVPPQVMISTVLCSRAVGFMKGIEFMIFWVHHNVLFVSAECKVNCICS